MNIMQEKMNGSYRELIIHPGETLKEILDDRGMLQKELAARTGCTEKHVSKVINGLSPISANFAKKLEYALGIDSSFWINLQGIYDKELQDYQDENDISDEEIEIANNNLKQISEYMYNVGIMRECGLINQKHKNVGSVIGIRKFLGVSSLTSIPEISIQGAFRGASNVNVDVYVLSVWQKLCEKLTENIHVTNGLDIKKLRDTIPNIKKAMFLEPEKMRQKLTSLFADCGIAFNIVKNFKGAPVQGFLKKTEDKIYLCMTIRQKFADIFWFTLFHEIAHILNNDIENLLIDYDFAKTKKEIRANEMARDMLVDKDKYKDFVEIADFSLTSIRKFANSVSVIPCIIIGRLQKEGLIGYNEYSNDKIKYVWVNN